MPVRLVMLDRDGTLIQAPPAGQRYTLDPEHVRLATGAARGVARLNRLGIAVAVVTNQRAVALGLVTPSGVDRVHARIGELLAEQGAHVDRWFICPHDVGTCQCRKPRPGLLLAALQAFDVRAADARMIGDSLSDLQAAHAVGVPAVGIGPDGVPGAGPTGDSAVPAGVGTWVSGLADALRLALAG